MLNVSDILLNSGLIKLLLWPTKLPHKLGDQRYTYNLETTQLEACESYRIIFRKKKHFGIFVFKKELFIQGNSSPNKIMIEKKQMGNSTRLK